jgi:flavin-dependent dehydrogenase
VEISRGDVTLRMPASVTIAADGRESVLARAANLSGHPRKPRRWAFGAYATDVGGMSDVGEMHIRRGHYVGLAPMGRGLTNVCVVTREKPVGQMPEDIIREALSRDPLLRERTQALQITGPPRTLGPLAVESHAPGIPGLLLAGDAAGFVDPMTGDGTHIAIRGGVLAATAALHALEVGDLNSAIGLLATSRRAELGSKLRFNRFLRVLSGSSTALELASAGARVSPSAIRRLVAYAGDVP